MLYSIIHLQAGGPLNDNPSDSGAKCSRVGKARDLPPRSLRRWGEASCLGRVSQLNFTRLNWTQLCPLFRLRRNAFFHTDATVTLVIKVSDPSLTILVRTPVYLNITSFTTLVQWHCWDRWEARIQRNCYNSYFTCRSETAFSPPPFRFEAGVRSALLATTYHRPGKARLQIGEPNFHIYRTLFRILKSFKLFTST